MMATKLPFPARRDAGTAFRQKSATFRHIGRLHMSDGVRRDHASGGSAARRRSLRGPDLVLTSHVEFAAGAARDRDGYLPTIEVQVQQGEGI